MESKRKVREIKETERTCGKIKGKVRKATEKERKSRKLEESKGKVKDTIAGTDFVICLFRFGYFAFFSAPCRGRFCRVRSRIPQTRLPGAMSQGRMSCVVGALFSH